MKNLLSRLARDRRGIALPVALVGLVAVSLLVTTAMLTSSTEFAISSAHRNAAASLFNADAAMEQYIVQRAQQVGADGIMMRPTTPQAPGTVVGPDGRNYTVRVARLSLTRDLNSRAPPMVTGTEVFALRTEPADGRGRAVAAFLRLMRMLNPLSTSLNAGATSGGDLRVSGNATISDGRTGTNYCGTTDNQSDYAVQVTAGSTIDAGRQEDRRLEGLADTTSYDKSQMADSLLGGMTLERLADQAEIKFGARWGMPEFGGTVINADPSTPVRYNWGCPAPLGVTCPTSAAAQRHVVVAIDARNLQNRNVIINGRYGQGMLIVLNGSLQIQGNFIYKGIILVQEDMYIRGGAAGEESKIEGGIVSFGSSSTVEDNVTGTATIKYNWCAIQDAEAAMNNALLDSAPQGRLGTTFAWYELIR